MPLMATNYYEFAKSDKQLPFAEAIDYFAGKTNLDTNNWVEGQGIVQQAAFTVAAAKGQLLQDIREAVAKAIEQGISIADFANTFNTIADRYSAGWNLKGDRAWRAQLIYDQNLRQAYAAGRYAQMSQPEVLKRRPYWQWRHGETRDPRPVHLAMDGRVFNADSLPFLAPAGFGCKCQLFSLSKKNLDREGLKVESLKLGDEIEWAGQKLRLKPDKGFEWKPNTKEWQQAVIKNLSPDLQKQVLVESNKSQE